MRIKNLIWLTVPIIVGSGCATYYHDPYAARSEVVTPAPTSTSSDVRVYPNPAPRTLESPPAASAVPGDEWNTAVRVRNLIAGDGYLKGAARNVDVEVIRGAAILRGTVASEYDREELAARIGQVTGVTVVDNRLVVAAR